MRHLAAAIAATLAFEDRATVERRRADALRELHRRPDALPDPVEPVRQSRRSLVSGAVVRRRRPATEGA
jgi:hypothetical protein